MPPFFSTHVDSLGSESSLALVLCLLKDTVSGLHSIWPYMGGQDLHLLWLKFQALRERRGWWPRGWEWFLEVLCSCSQLPWNVEFSQKPEVPLFKSSLQWPWKVRPRSMIMQGQHFSNFDDVRSTLTPSLQAKYSLVISVCYNVKFLAEMAPVLLMKGIKMWDMLILKDDIINASYHRPNKDIEY